MNSYVGTPDAQSQVYRLDTVSKTVTAVEDSELQTSRKAYTQNFIAQAASPERIQEQYESAFTSLLEIANRLDTYQDVSTTTGEQDGRRLQYVIYNLSNQGPVLIDPNVISANGIAASKAEFARDIESNLILWAKLYDNQGQLIYHVEVQAFDEQPTAPENILTLEAWKAHTATLK